MTPSSSGAPDPDAPFIHETACVDDGAEIGPGTSVWNFSHVRGSAHIGRNCILGQNVYVDADVRVGDGVKIENNVSIYTGVEIEDFAFLGPSMVFTNVINPRAHVERKAEFRPTRVRRGATIGANATIVCGVEIGEFAFIAAGAVVRRSVPAFALMAGVAVHRLGWICQCGNRLYFHDEREDAEVACKACGARYRLLDNAEHLEMIKEPEKHWPWGKE